MIRRRGSSPAAALEDDDMLGEILLRLPPQPSSLARASAVCKRWRGIVTDHGFLGRFRAHHLEPPLLGVFHHADKLTFTPILPAPDRITPPCSANTPNLDNEGRLLGCRHGLVLILRWVRAEVLVCDPITGNQRCVPFPPKFKMGYINGAVICAAHDHGHVHGGCHSTPFKVTETWGDLISAKVPCPSCSGAYISTLVGNVLYWSFQFAKEGILGFDLEKESFDVLEGPPGMNLSHSHQIMQAEDGTVGLAMLFPRYHNIQMWQRKVNCHGVATWVLSRTIDIHNILELPPQGEGEKTSLEFMKGHVEDTDVIFLYVKGSVYMVQLKSMQSMKLYETHNNITYCHSLRSFYAPGDYSSLVLILLE
ncbi:hypothetical protein VPH35_133760 [Triticum aestivum]